MALDGSDEQVIIDGPYNWPAEVFTDGQISNPRWSPDGSMIAFNRAVVDPIFGERGHEVHVVFADGTGEQEVTELLACTPPLPWPAGRSVEVSRG